jgi:hypothetical protein
MHWNAIRSRGGLGHISALQMPRRFCSLHWAESNFLDVAPFLLTIHDTEALCLGIFAVSSEAIEIRPRQMSVHSVKLWIPWISEAAGWTLIAASPRFSVFLHDFGQSASCGNKYLLVIRMNVCPYSKNSTGLSSGFREPTFLRVHRKTPLRLLNVGDLSRAWGCLH